MIDIRAQLERNLHEMGIMAYIIAKHQQEYLDGIEGLKKLMIPSEVAVMRRLSVANRDFIKKTNESFKKKNVDFSAIEPLVMEMLDRIELEFEKL